MADGAWNSVTTVEILVQETCRRLGRILGTLSFFFSSSLDPKRPSHGRSLLSKRCLNLCLRSMLGEFKDNRSKKVLDEQLDICEGKENDESSVF